MFVGDSIGTRSRTNLAKFYIFNFNKLREVSLNRFPPHNASIYIYH